MDDQTHERYKTKNNEAPAGDFVIGKIFYCKINTSQQHCYAKAGEPLYRVRFYDNETEH